MKAKIAKAYIIFIVCLFALAILVFVGGVSTQYYTQKKNAQNNFKTIPRSTSIVFENDAVDAAAIKTGMERIFEAYANLAAITVEINGAPVFAQQVNIGFISFSRNDEPVITAESPMLQTFSAVFTTKNGTNGLTTAVLYVLKPDTVYKTARLSFLIILVATVFAIIFVVLNQQTDAPHSKQAADDSYIPRERTTAFTTSIPAKQAVRASVPIDKDADTHADDLQSVVPPHVRIENAPDTQDTPAAQSFISPVTGFTWESFLESRLEAELQRATELEQDLALFIVVFPNIERASEIANEIFKQISHQFRYTDYIFEYKMNGAAAVVQNSSIDDSLRQAERLYVKLSEILEPKGGLPQFGIGISNRTFRIISAGRLIGEADEAAHRALESPETPVVALKIDPVKYREYLSSVNLPYNSNSAENYSS
jgi:flagellar basal body-associated protein FliL